MENTMLSDIKEVLYSEAYIDSMVKRVGAEISRDYADKNLLLVSVLKGSVVFMADLMRAITIPARIDFMCVSSYGSGTKTSGVVKIIKDLDGDLSGKDVSLIDDPTETDGEALSTLLRQYYVNRSNWPKTILLPFEPEDKEDIERWLSDMAGRRVYLEVPQRGDRARFAEKAAVNAREEILRSTTAEQRRSKTLSWLQEALRLTEFPHRIEAYDISNTGSTGIVASMTVHVDGKPLKSAYRKFHLKDMQGPDDYASMDQVLPRRFRRYLEDNEKFNVLPDVILMDGGLGQVGVACRVLAQAGLDVPVFGMVKDGRHRTRALVAPDGREIGLQAQPAIFALVGRIQEETHRYAISFHHTSHSKRTVASALEEIPSVGEVRRNQLLKHFKSVKAIREADYEALCKAVPKSVAQAVYTHFHGTTGETEGGSKE